jgi:hypothetical protein
MRAHGSKLGVKTRPQNCQKLENIFGKIEIFLAQNPIFLAQNSIFFNGFPISEKSEKIFFNGFLSSSTAFQFSSTAFHFPRNPGKSIDGGKYTKDRYPSFVFQPKLRFSALKNYPSFVFSAPSFVILAN